MFLLLSLLKYLVADDASELDVVRLDKTDDEEVEVAVEVELYVKVKDDDDVDVLVPVDKANDDKVAVPEAEELNVADAVDVAVLVAVDDWELRSAVSGASRLDE